MSRHIADHPSPENAGLRHFLRLSREEGRHPAVRALHMRRPATTAESRITPLLKKHRAPAACRPAPPPAADAPPRPPLAALSPSGLLGRVAGEALSQYAARPRRLTACARPS